MSILDKLQSLYPESYRKGGVLLINADCMEVMKDAPDKNWDLCCVDPPYGIDWNKQTKTVNTKANWIQHDFKDWDSAAPEPTYFYELRRVSANQIIWGANHFIDSMPFNCNSPCWIVWDKMQEFTGATFEMAWTSFKSPAKAFRMARCEAYVGVQKIHPTQKPVKLYEWLLTNYAKQGDKILDTHLGSGSSAIAAHYGGFEFVGIELDKDYFEAAVSRFEQATKQLSLI
jgi:site-specific DNA-methyltransferase (adenine-specific)